MDMHVKGSQTQHFQPLDGNPKLMIVTEAKEEQSQGSWKSTLLKVAAVSIAIGGLAYLAYTHGHDTAMAKGADGIKKFAKMGDDGIKTMFNTHEFEMFPSTNLPTVTGNETALALQSASYQNMASAEEFIKSIDFKGQLLNEFSKQNPEWVPHLAKNVTDAPGFLETVTNTGKELAKTLSDIGSTTDKAVTVVGVGVAGYALNALTGFARLFVGGLRIPR